MSSSYGVWVTYIQHATTPVTGPYVLSIHSNEVAALREALGTSARVAFVRWGETILSAVEREMATER